jgi:tRNA A-37 threonylcarbamoyl transferase component Bud32
MNAGAVPEALLAALRREGLDTVEGAFAYDGGEELGKCGLGRRRRTRLRLTDGEGRRHLLYLKRYGAEPVSAALRRRLTHGRWCSAARVELDNIRRARAAGVPTMRAVSCGEEPVRLGAGRSYLIATAVPGEALERCFEPFLRRHARDGKVAAVTSRLARLVRALHDAGYVHRDLYASHVFLDDAAGEPQLYLIDLARMFAPRWRPLRWYVKDVAQLKYSMPPAWVAECWQAFLAEYLPGVGPRGLRAFDAAVDRKVASMRRRAERRRSARQGGGGR